MEYINVVIDDTGVHKNFDSKDNDIFCDWCSSENATYNVETPTVTLVDPSNTAKEEVENEAGVKR